MHDGEADGLGFGLAQRRLAVVPGGFLLVLVCDPQQHGFAEGAPTSCRPIGRLSLEKPQGTVSAGWPLRLNGIVMSR